MIKFAIHEKVNAKVHNPPTIEDRITMRTDLVAVKTEGLTLHTTKSSGSSAGGGGSYLPMRKCSMPVQATITPSQFKSKVLS